VPEVAPEEATETASDAEVEELAPAATVADEGGTVEEAGPTA